MHLSRGIRITVVYKTAHIDRTLALVAEGMGVSFSPAGLKDARREAGPGA
jgi:hypothetical protein